MRRELNLTMMDDLDCDCDKMYDCCDCGRIVMDSDGCGCSCCYSCNCCELCEAEILFYNK